MNDWPCGFGLRWMNSRMCRSISKPRSSTQSIPLPYFGAFRHSWRVASWPSQFASIAASS